MPITGAEMEEIIPAPEEHIAIVANCSPLIKTINSVAELCEAPEQNPALGKLLTRINAARVTAPRQLVIDALAEAEKILEFHHEKIGDNTVLRTLATDLHSCGRLAVDDSLNITIPRSLPKRAPRPPLETPMPTDIGSQYYPTTEAPIPFDLNVVHDLNVGNDLSVGGEFIIVGPIIFENDVFLRPLPPTNTIAVHFDTNTGSEIARIYTPSTGPTGGIVISTTAGVTENFRVQGDGDTQITGNLTLANNGNLTLGTLAIVYKPSGTKFIHTSGGAGNTYLGSAAGDAAATGATYNTGIGYQALTMLTGATGGDSNTAIGANSLAILTTGSTNSAIGRQALARMNTGTGNAALGYRAGYNYTNGETNNVCIGTNVRGTALESNTIRIGTTSHNATYITGIDGTNVGASGILVGIASNDQLGTAATDWTINGNEILTGNLTLGTNAIVYKPAGTTFIHTSGGAGNTYVGAAAGNTAASGANYNTSLGASSLSTISSGDYNVALGYQALNQVNTGSNHACLGYRAGYNYVNGETGNICIGSGVTGYAGESSSIRIGNTTNTSSSNTIRLGGTSHNATYITGIDGTNVGSSGILVGIASNDQLGTAATDWTINGNEILTGNLTLGTNAIVYKPAGTTFIHTSGGTGNTYLGAAAGNTAASSATYNTGIGYQALTALTGATGGDNNVAVGGHALAALATGSRNIGIGRDALDLLSTGNDNIGIGYQVLDALTGTGTSGGSDNTAIGYAALGTLTEGNHNIAIGYSALSALDTGANNVAIGWMAGQNYNGAVTNNIAVGYNVQGNSGESNAIRIGDTSTTLNSNAIRIGTSGTHTSCYIQGIRTANVGATALPVYINNVGQLGTTPSSAEFKENIADLPDQLTPFLQLRPVTFNYIGDDPANVQMGLIAEEVVSLFPQLIVYADDGITPYGVKYYLLPALLIKELQQAYQQIATLQTQVAALLAANPDVKV
ncbi:MAG: tail fiber domain-containing protein [Candidatus Dependentiae bacterium]|nr:tail fiber domain-containing protein [Candidatus Dependentiae bacterium]